MKSRGFTIVELITVIAIIGIIATIVIFGLGSWRSRSATTEVKTELLAATSTLKNNRMLKNSPYPSDQSGFNSVYAPNAKVDLVYAVKPGGYCITGTSQVVATVIWRIDSTGRDIPEAGTCS